MPDEQRSDEASGALEGAGAAAEIERIRRALELLANSWARRFGESVCDLEVRALESEARAPAVLVEGQVLVPSQRAAVLRTAEAAAPGLSTRFRVEALSEIDLEKGWARSAVEVLDITAGPGGELATQVLPSDPPLRKLVRRGDHWALELADATVGWAPARDLLDLPAAEVPDSREAWRRAWRGTGRGAGVEDWRSALQRWMGSPYRWGGNAPDGIDCSGLTQRLFKSVRDLGLPKHSSDQARVGRRVARKELRPGDLLYLSHIERRIGHVGIFLGGESAEVAHASFDANAVVVEPLEAMLARYRFRGARRFDGPGALADSAESAAAGSSGEAIPRAEPTAMRAGSGSGSNPARDPATDPEREARREAAWAALRALRDRNVHVVGTASTEGAALLRFLAAEGFSNLTAHDFQPPEDVAETFRRFHVGMPPALRETIWREIEALPIKRRFGRRYLEGVESADAVFAGQAWYLYPANLPALSDLKASGVPFFGLTRLYFDLAPAEILAVTGSNGKSTTSRLVETILRLGSRKTYYAGNERRSVQVLDRIRHMQSRDLLVLEVSNRQLLDLQPRPQIGVITNVLPNHLDEHEGSFEAYARVKEGLIRHQAAGDIAILNADNPATLAMARGREDRVFFFSRRTEPARGAWLADGRIQLRDEVGGPVVDLGPVSAARIIGAHNEENILAASLAAWLAGSRADEIQRGIRMFRGLRHRLQFVWQAEGVDYYDDLNSTSPQATVAALTSLPAPIVLIAGGDDKGLDCAELARVIVERVERLVLLQGDGSDRIERAVRREWDSRAARPDDGPDRASAATGPRIDRFEDFRQAVASVVAEVEPGRTVLLSPACPFFFRRNYLGSGGQELGFKALLRAEARRRP